jgi:hypothetical protein
MALGRSARRFVSHLAYSCKITDLKKAVSGRVNQTVSPFVRFHVGFYNIIKYFMEGVF